MTEQNDSTLISDVAKRNGVSEGAVKTVYDALRAGHGTMAQFSHPEFGGMAQWSSGMTMVGDMFNDRMKATLNAVASELADHIRKSPAPRSDDREESEVSYRSSSRPSSSWWPSGLGSPSSTGAQNDLRYAIFPDSRRLVIDDGGNRTVYDTGDHRISGVSQAQSSDQTITFNSQNGLVRLSELQSVKE